MTMLEPVQTAVRPDHLSEVSTPTSLPSASFRSSLRASSYVTAPGAVPVRIGAYRRGARASRPVAAISAADVTYGDFFVPSEA
jgi:hypothetical protein